MKPRACIVVSSEMTIRAFLVRQLAAMAAQYDVTVVVNTKCPGFLAGLGLSARLHPLAIERRVSIVRDLRCLLDLFRLMRNERFDLVHSFTPKAGLLAMLAARAAGIPVRIHTFTGQVWATRRGPVRALLRLVDRLLAGAATFTLADSPSQRQFLISEGVVAASRLGVPGAGSVSGVDPVRFRPDACRRHDLRARFGMGPGDVVLLFVGRVTRDKGVLDLARAFSRLAGEHRGLRLLVAGPDEEDLSDEIVRLCGTYADRLHLLEFTSAPEELMAASDILCLPSYREGFGMVIVEAAAAGLPAVASRIYGIVDAVVEGTTGLLHEPGDVNGLVARLRELIANEALRARLGAGARTRAARDFSQEAVTTAVLEIYGRLLGGGERRPSSTEAEPVSLVANVEGIGR